jgi:hypothetical protein
MGNRTQVTETLAQVGGGTTTNNVTYTYDRLYRLKGDGTRTYDYDPVGNRTANSGLTCGYDRADRIQTCGATGYTVDAAGNPPASSNGTGTYVKPGGWDQSAGRSWSWAGSRNSRSCPRRTGSARVNW